MMKIGMRKSRRNRIVGSLGWGKSFFGERKRVGLLKMTIFVVKLRNIDYVLSSSSKFVFTQGLCYVRFLER